MRRPKTRNGWLIASFLGVFGALAIALATHYAVQTSGVTVPRRTTAQTIELLAPHIDVAVPDGEGPFPAIVLLHGCGGRQAMFDDYAELARNAGIVAITPDSFTPRGLSRREALAVVCTGAAMHGGERAGDLLAVLEWAKQRRDVDPQRIAVAGWSHGGWAIMDLFAMDLEGGATPTGLTDAHPEALDGVGAALLFYPFCQFPARARDHALVRDVALEAVIGSADIVVGLAACERIFERERDAGRDIAWDIWPDLTHAFDDPDQPATSPHRFDADGAASARQVFSDFLRRRLGAEPTG